MRQTLRKMAVWLMVAMQALMLFTACGADTPSGSNKYVATFTTGSVSRFENILLILNNEVPQDVRLKVAPDDFMSISPSVKGKFLFADGHTIAFVPDGEFDREQTYTVKAKLSEIIPEAEGDDSKFVFQFSTLPYQVASAYLSEMTPTDDEKGYKMVFVVNTADKESRDALMEDVASSCGVDSWDEGGNGLAHTLRVDVPIKPEASEITIASRKCGDLVTVEVPGANSLTVYDAAYKSAEGQSFIEVVFSKNLDPNQDLKGLAYIVGNKKSTVDVSENKLRLYPEGTAGVKSVTIFLAGTIRSAGGATLGDDIKQEVELLGTKPDVRFTSEGTIMPLASNVVIPFKSIGMRAVRVKVFKVFRSNMGAMLQEDDINASYHLARYGTPMAVKTIELERDGVDLMAWHTFGIDITQLFNLEKGTVYRVEIEMDKNHSAWPDVEGAVYNSANFDKEDAEALRKLRADFNRGESWYSNGYWWDEGNGDPSTAEYYRTHKVASRNVLATNLGLTSISNGPGKMRVVVLNLPDATPRQGVSVELYSYQNQKIASAQTTADGYADLEYDAETARPWFVIARDADDVSYLRTVPGENISTSTFDVSGQVIQNGIKGFVYGERGVWRPGDEVHLAAIIQSADGTLPADHPVSLELRNPLGLIYKQMTSTEGKFGIYTFSIPTEASVPTGKWTATVSVGAATFTKTIRIETIKPNRLKIDLNLPKVVKVAADNTATLHTEWLTGARAHDMRYEVAASMLPAETKFDKYPNYVFEDPTKKQFRTDNELTAKGETDSDGDASFSFNPSVVGNAPGMVMASVTTRVFEPTGEFSTDVSRCKVSPYSRYVGLRSPQDGNKQLDTDKDHTFSLISVDADGRPQASASLNIAVYKVSYWWWWSVSNDEMANYTAQTWNRPVFTTFLTTDANGKASFTQNIARNDWGTYLITATDRNSGHTTGMLAYFDWPEISGRSENGSAAATTLDLTLDKSEYSVGETMNISLPSSKGAKAIVNICRGSKIVSTQIVNCEGTRTTVPVMTTGDMMPNVYAIVSLVQPYENTKNDSPIRLFGVAQASVVSPSSHLTPVVAVADEVPSLKPMTVTVGEKDGREMGYTLAVVDEGLLDLTHFQTPDPWSTFNAKEALGLNIWDLYNHVAGAYGGRIERLFSIGGDEALNNGPKAIVNRFTPMVYFGGPFTLAKGEKKSHTIDVPNYMGRVRVMVVATDGKAMGSADKSVKVANKLMLLGTMPRQIGVGDKATVSATIFASKALGKVTVSIEAKDGVKVVGENRKTIDIKAAGDVSVPFSIEAADSEGEATISLSCSGGGEKADYNTRLTVRKVTTLVPHTETVSIAPGSKWTSKKPSLSAGSDVKSTAIELSTMAPLNLANRVDELIAYPHGCAEQTTSRILGQLYLADFANLSDAGAERVERNVKSGLASLASSATPDGGVAYWPGQTSSDLWCSAYVYLCYTAAQSKGYVVSTSTLRSLKRYLVGKVDSWRSADYDNAPNIAFALFALSASGDASASSLNRLENALAKLGTAKSHSSYVYAQTCYYLAAAQGKMGKTDAAKKNIASVKSSSWGRYSDNVRNAALLIALTKAKGADVATVAETVRKTLADEKSWISTFETGLSIMAWHDYAQAHCHGNSIRASVSTDGGKSQKIDTEKLLWSESLAAGGSHNFKVENDGKNEIRAVVTTVEAASQSAVAANSNGLNVSVAGMPGGAVRAGESFRVSVQVTNPSVKNYSKLAVSFILPAGAEILKVSDSNVFDHFDIRDDRVYAYAETLAPGAVNSASFDVTISATYAGDYYVPATDARLMYDEQTQGNSPSGRLVIE